ncbi:MAG: hypothetical protein K0S71_223 [Clostridia bacterium]|jgi:hypothetical protein|nr:hypothetical protein [Clostridia bacterium]
MLFGEKAEQIFKEFMYEKGRNKNKGNHSSKDKGMFFAHLTEVLDEMEEYLDEKIKEYQHSKKK